MSAQVLADTVGYLARRRCEVSVLGGFSICNLFTVWGLQAKSLQVGQFRA